MRKYRSQQRKPVVCARQRQTLQQQQQSSSDALGMDRQVLVPGNHLTPEKESTGGNRQQIYSEGIVRILGHSSLRVTRQLEMMNIFLGYEQANKYALLDPQGNAVGFMAEEFTLWSTIGRQFLRLHRPFRVHVLDLNGNPCMTIWRNFSLINSRVFVSAVDDGGRVVGESQQQWHLWRRRYSLFVDHTNALQHRDGDEKDNGSSSSQQLLFDRRQFAETDAPFLSWDFPFLSQDGTLLGGVFRDFSGIGMELFTDYGLYAVCFDRLALAQRYQLQLNGNDSQQTQNSLAGMPGAVPHSHSQVSASSPALASRDLNLDERAVALAAAVSIDFDYFSRHSRMGGGGGGGFWIFPFSASNDYTDS
ncbi:hypothetical protein GGI11_005111 [Coemansia sp. RSA 2049]|nr:hypothetical protein GGI11_005111 [Coemansia sp. RSA 2049]KAJ2519079.1 hypothetical protein H4217_002923 [Coemansia sp. RSA 1939]KAJ2612706.1 hypothetical protein EV177_002857 [Coemansia sp. RSA 1804]KAJ2694518.1 hypothetical protein GGH99_000637 [Coemansia sp. RSA 1285]